jgi:REP element-mobilizing transposase RayT
VDRCVWKQWRLYAAHVRSNHVHILVHSPEKIDKVMVSLKAWATRKLRENGYHLEKVWTHHGSTKYVFTKDKMYEKVQYVIHEQGEKMACYFEKMACYFDQNI